MIQLEIIQGQVDFINELTHSCLIARNKMEINTSGEFHYLIKTYDNSYATVIVNGQKVYLKPNSEFNLSNIKGRIKTQPKLRNAKILVGRIWAAIMSKVGNENMDDQYNGNAVVGVRG